MSRWPNKYVIGLTGNIAVGKSVVRQMLQHLGAYTIDADSLSHRAMAPGAPAYKPIIETFGQFILDADKNINRTMLGNIVFSNPAALAKLEALVHPVVGQAIASLVSRATQPVIVIEAIKLLEGDLSKIVDEVWVVNSSPATQLQRLVEKRKMSEGEAKQRIAAQNAQSEKINQASLIIQNDSNVEETWKQVQSGWMAVSQKNRLAPNSTQTLNVGTQTQPLSGGATAPLPPRPSAPAPVAVAAAPAAAVAVAAPITVIVKRGMPGNAEPIAAFISQLSGKKTTRMDIMMAFGQKSYLLAQDSKERVLAVIGWQVENLITRVDEFYLAPDVPTAPVVNALITAIEAASKDLQSEVAFLFLPPMLPSEAIQTVTSNSYENVSIEQIKIPAWREAVQEIISNNLTSKIYTKRLRADRVLKPI